MLLRGGDEFKDERGMIGVVEAGSDESRSVNLGGVQITYLHTDRTLGMRQWAGQVPDHPDSTWF